MAEIFGYEFKRKAKEELPSFAPPRDSEDGATVITAGGAYGTYVDLDGTVRSEAELVTRYREMSLQPECDAAIDEIINESIAIDEKELVEINLEEVKISDPVKKIIKEEFQNCLNILEFNKYAYEIYRRWYIDGRIYYHVVIDDKNPKDGIKEIRYIDPRKIRKVREVQKKRIRGTDNPADTVVTKTVNEYFIFNDRGFNFGNKSVGPSTTGLKIAKDSILYVVSGLTDNQGTMVLSYLHKSIKALNQLRTLEDALVIYRLARAPERRIWYIDVGNLPKMKAEQYVRDIMVKHKNRLIYDAQSGEVRDDRKFMCYALDTKIPLLDGRTLELQELINEYEQGKTNWVYSCDPITGKFVPGPVSWAGITKRNSQVVRVTFDNGKSVICTPDHKFPVWDKGFIEAKDLVGESIIPGYRREKALYKNQTYEQIYKNDTKTWEFTHREVANWKNLVGIREELLHDQKYINESKNTIHHKNFNRFDNSPHNLIMISRNDHMKYHWDCAKYGFGKRVNKPEDFTPEWKMKLSIAAKKRTPWCKSWKIITPEGEEIITENLNEFCRQNNLNRSNIKYKTSKGYKAEKLYNHKAISVEWLEEKIDVGCITVDLEETYHSHHTYLLDAGVYTKNTMLEDYWLPRREGGRGTEVTTLPGGQNLGQMDDVLYFQKKFLQTLNVPVSRLNSDALFSLGRATEITRDELKFNRFIVRLRARFAILFTKLLEKQLILKGITTPEDWAEIAGQIKYDFSKDNYFAELKNSEITQGRIELARNIQDFAGKYYSHKWIRENILQQSEDDIEESDFEIIQETQSGEPRWVNPAIEQNAQSMQQQQGGDQAEQQQGGEDQQSPDEDNKIEKIRQAMLFVKQMKEKGVENRSMQDQSKYKQAVQVIAKNPDIAKSLGASKEQVPE